MEGIVVLITPVTTLPWRRWRGYLKSGKMKSKEDVVTGLNNFPEALISFSLVKTASVVLEVATN
jgi:NADPH-dependent curcumin reductase CurA